jgi:hypothetical protein
MDKFNLNNTAKQALLEGQATSHGQSVIGLHSDHFLVDFRVQHGRNYACAHSLDLVGAHGYRDARSMAGQNGGFLKIFKIGLY